eukprot:827931-Pleurochrysis_carterae.AAC.2
MYMNGCMSSRLIRVSLTDHSREPSSLSLRPSLVWARDWLQLVPERTRDIYDLKIAWPAFQGLHNVYQGHFRRLGRQFNTHLAVCEPVYFFRGPSVAIGVQPVTRTYECSRIYSGYENYLAAN